MCTQGPKRIILFVGGFMGLALATVGTLLPVMPTAPFLLLAVYCFARSSTRCHDWLTGNRLFGRYVAGIAQGKKLSLPIKAALLACMGSSASLSAVFLAPNATVRIITLCLMVPMATYIILQGRGERSPVRRG